MMSDNDPPVGFRKAIPLIVKMKAVLRVEGKCVKCGLKLGELEDLEFDHVPALALRRWDPSMKDTIPGANDPLFINPMHKDCHRAKTTGRKGASKLSKVGGDTSEVAKLRRIQKDQESFKSRLLAKDTEDGVDSAPMKRAWPKRPFPKRAKP